jgi:hypothetical protein
VAGLYDKYEVRKKSGEPPDPEAFYFVLRLDTDPIAREVAHIYAHRIAPRHAALAADLHGVCETLGQGSMDAAMRAGSRLYEEWCQMPPGTDGREGPITKGSAQAIEDFIEAWDVMLG